MPSLVIGILISSLVAVSPLGVLPARLPLGALQDQDERPPAELLKMVEEQASRFKDLSVDFTLRIFDPEADHPRDVSATLQKKAGKSVVRFSSPDDIKGMGFLFENVTSIYSVLPAYGNRVRRVAAGTAALRSFMGSDFTLEELLQVSLSELWEAKAAASEDKAWILTLTSKGGKEEAGRTQKVWISKERKAVVRIEEADAAGKKTRTLTFSDFTEDAGGSGHFTPRKATAIDHQRQDHRSELEVKSAKIDQDLGDDLFSKKGLLPK